MIGRGLVNRLVASFVAAGAAFVAVVALGATVFYALALVLSPLGASAITAGLFALIALGVAMVFLNKGTGDHDDEDDEHEPEGLGGRAYALFRSRPVLGTVAALAGGWIFLRNPALASIVTAAFAERARPRYRR